MTIPKITVHAMILSLLVLVTLQQQQHMVQAIATPPSRPIHILSRSISQPVSLPPEIQGPPNSKESLQGEPQSSLPVWPQPFLVADGDYRDQAFLEDVIGGPLYAAQHQLPRLPVPSLEESIQTFLPTALPLARNTEEEASLVQAAQAFPKEAQVLQARLLQRQATYSDSSWLQQLWNTQGYLQCRDPIALIVSYFLFVPDDKTLPPSKLPGLARAAAILSAVATSRQLICSGQMAQETLGQRGKQETMCSSFFKYVFHTCRVPQPHQDCYHMYDPSQHKHCLVAYKGRFFAVDFVDDHDDPLPVLTLQERLRYCMKSVDNETVQRESVPQMGWLTSTNRTFWAQARQELLDVGGDTMEQALTKIESAAFLLNLDDEEPETKTDAARIFWHGGDTSGANRWFDKTMQIVCTTNGRVAYLGEHSMLDAAPIVSVISRILKTTYKRLLKREGDVFPSDPTTGVQDVFEKCWASCATKAKAEELIEIAKDHHRKLSGEYDIKVYEFQGYGKKFLKSANTHCDSFVQMAMQVASYRLFGEQVATYEAALTRNFLHGRTATTRTISPECQAFIEAMGSNPSPGQNKEMKSKLLLNAISAHAEYHSKASSGRGVDRHFFGLANMLQKGESKPALFSHPLFDRSRTWRLTTSFVTYFPGFGPVVDDGIGIGYGIDSNSCQFTCTSKHANNYLEKFSSLLNGVLDEMGDLLETEPKE